MKSTVVLLVLAAASAWAQNTPPVFTPNGDPGVSRAILIDRPEIRVLRVEIEPGGARKPHKHDDVQYHLFVVIEGTFEVTIGSDAPVQAPGGRTLLFKAGTMHGPHSTVEGCTVLTHFSAELDFQTGPVPQEA